MKRVIFLLILAVLLLPAALVAMQESPSVNLELTSASAADFPTVVLTANVFDTFGQPLLGLTDGNFTIVGELADRARVVRVENITDDNLPFSVVLVIDTSSSIAGEPFERIKEAAIAFVNQIGEQDSVAIVTFDSDERVVQDFTTDKDVLVNAINNLSFGGQTSLYDGAMLGVDTAADGGLPRRAVILLSDGAEFGGRSSALRPDAIAEARARGVPVYTIGLGFGIDRSYLRELSDGTLTQFYESPTPDELTTIYSELAAKFRSQYIITLEMDVPADGTTYDLELQVNTDQGTDTASGQFRAPVPVPVIILPEFPDALTEPTEITAEVLADEVLTSAEFLVDGASVTTPTEPPYTITVDPALLAPGDHELTFNVTDESGDPATASATFTVDALPSAVTIVGLDGSPIAEPVTVLLDVTGQTPAVSATYSIDGGEGVTVEEVPFNFTIDPSALPPGDHTLSVEVVNEGGATATAEAGFTVEALPPSLSIEGIESGQEVAEPVEVTVSVVGQSPVTNLTAVLGGEEIVNVAEPSATFTIDPNVLQPGDNALEISAVTESGDVSSTVDFTVATLPPSNIVISGLDVGATIEENTIVAVDAATQSPLSGVTFTVDGEELAALTEAPFETELDVLELGPGPHILSVEAVNAGGSATADVAFVVSDGPSLTATALVPTNTPTPTNTPVPTINRTGTAEAAALAADTAATQTADAQLLQMLTDQAVSEADAQATLNAVATTEAETTISAAANDADATADARATANALATASQEAASDAGATADAQGTFDAQASLAAQSALDAQSTLDAETQASADATETRSAVLTMTADAEEAAATSEATVEATAEETEDATTVAQVASPTASGDEENQTPSATLTPVPLTSETQGAAQSSNNILPVLCIVIALVVLIVLGFLVLGRQRRENTNR